MNLINAKFCNAAKSVFGIEASMQETCSEKLRLKLIKTKHKNSITCICKTYIYTKVH